MPKIRIREVDNTGTPNLGAIPNIVYIPGKAVEAFEPVLYTSAKAFKKDFDDGKFVEDLSAKMAYQLLKYGMQVLYEGFVVEEVASGVNPTINVDWSKLEDKALYDIRFLTTGGYWCPTKEMVACAAKRCDAIALLDTRDVEVESVRLWIEALATEVKTAWEGNTTSEPMSFAASFVPTIKVNIIGLDDSVSEEWCPASFGYLCAYAQSVQTNPIWYAAAGSYRGVIPGLVDVLKKYTTAEVEILQARAKDEEVALGDKGDNVGIAINPIVYQRPFGVLVWGNRTSRDNQEDEDGTGLVKATSFLNVRLLATEVAKTAYNAARKYTFEQNSEVLWTNFTSRIIPTLEKMSTGNGILDYTIARVPTTKKARLAAKITLVPIEAVEDFDIEIELADEISITE